MPFWSTLGAIGKAVAGPLLGIGGQAVNRNASKQDQERQHRYNMELGKYNFDNQVKMWNMQNEYNDPKAQMRRLQEAGINPHMAYAKGGVQNTASSMSAPPAPSNLPNLKSPLPENLGTQLGAYQDIQMKESQRALLDKQNEMLDEKIRTESINRAIKTVTSGIKELEYDEKKYLSQYTAEFVANDLLSKKNKNALMLSDLKSKSQARSLASSAEGRAQASHTIDMISKGHKTYGIQLANQMTEWINNWQMTNEKKFGTSWEIGELIWQFAKETGIDDLMADELKKIVNNITNSAAYKGKKYTADQWRTYLKTHPLIPFN
jgi:hypothetical protein